MLPSAQPAAVLIGPTVEPLVVKDPLPTTTQQADWLFEHHADVAVPMHVLQQEGAAPAQLRARLESQWPTDCLEACSLGGQLLLFSPAGPARDLVSLAALQHPGPGGFPQVSPSPAQCCAAPHLWPHCVRARCRCPAGVVPRQPGISWWLRAAAGAQPAAAARLAARLGPVGRAATITGRALSAPPDLLGAGPGRWRRGKHRVYVERQRGRRPAILRVRAAARRAPGSAAPPGLPAPAPVDRDCSEELQ
jgi:hypothetical protein